MSKVKWNYIFGAVTITAIVGGTVYVIIKAKQAEKIAEEAISVDEAMEMVRKNGTYGKFEKGEESVIFKATFDDVPLSDSVTTIKPGKVRATKVSDMEYDEGLEEIMEDDEDKVEPDEYAYLTDDTPGPSIEPLTDFEYYEDGINPKEDKTLRFNKDSTEARNQFIRMELSDWDAGDDVYQIMLKLVEQPFIPTTDGDEVLRTQIIDYKVQFFGLGSRWNREVSFADVILHYARRAHFECGESVQYWVDYFMEFNGFYYDTTSVEIDKLLLRLNSHTYFNDERQTFGLFGLTRESFDQAIANATRNVDRSVTYEIEFQEFLKSCL